jgi:CxxC-x17-CxxC domain-containing protein
MGDFRKGGGKRFGGDRRSGGGFGRNRDRGSVTMHQAVCDQCGKPCEVPFVPTRGKPVYCNDCFGGRKETGNRGGERFSGNNELKEQLEMLNVKMERLIGAVEAMTSMAPVNKPVRKTSKK